MHVDIAICTWNRCDLLRATLEAMSRLEHPINATWSILVVDNNCTDETQSVVASFIDQLPLRSVIETKPGLSNGRNRAIQEVDGDYILFTDDDVLPDVAWLAEFVRVAQRYPHAAAIGGPIIPWFPQPPDETLMAVYHWLRDGFCGLDYGLAEGPMPPGLNLTGANFALNLAAVRGHWFNPALGPTPNGGLGDDVEYLQRVQAAGHSFVWCPTMRVAHYVAPARMTREYVERYAYMRGEQTILMSDSLRTPGPNGVPRWFWREWGITMLNHFLAKWLRISPTLPSRLRSGPVPDLPLSPHIRQLTWRREYLYLSGMLAGYRQPRGEGI
jgi:glycosyltransferase involved in cell wall biosynthesis